MMYLVVSDNAHHDMDEIWWYIAQDNPPAADRIIYSIREMFGALVSMPYMGVLRHDFGRDMRQMIVGRYAIFYTPHEDHIHIVRVLHSARDIPSLFESPTIH